MQLSAFLCLLEQASKEALAAELAARGTVVEEGKKKVRNTFGQSNFLFTILSWIVWLSVAVSKHRNEDVMKTPRARHLLKHRQKPHTTCWNGRYSLVLSHTIQNKLVLWTLHVHSEPDVQTNWKPEIQFNVSSHRDLVQRSMRELLANCTRYACLFMLKI